MSGIDGLNRRAYQRIPEGDSYEPYVSALEEPAEFTVRAACTGVLFGVFFRSGKCLPRIAVRSHHFDLDSCGSYDGGCVQDSPGDGKDKEQSWKLIPRKPSARHQAQWPVV